VDGKTRYFNYKYPNTERGYRLALADWQQDLAEIEAEQAERRKQECRQQTRKLAEIEAKREDAHPDWRQTNAQVVKDLDAGHDLKEVSKRGAVLMHARASLREGRYRDTAAATSHLAGDGQSDGMLIQTLLDDYLKHERQRVEHGKRFPNAPRRERLAEATYVTKMWTVKSLAKAIGHKRIPEEERRMGRLIREFRSEQVGLLNRGEIKPNTLNERIKILRHFLGWAYEQYLIPELPRNLAELCSKYAYKPTPKALDTEVVRQLFSAADERMQCFIALGLNCGFYSGSDIATLKREHVKKKYLIRPRGKTDVPTRFKLWPVTRKLIAAQSASDGDLLFVNANGDPLVSHNLETGVRHDNIRSAFWRLCRKAGVEGVSFSHLRDTSSTHIEQIDPGLTDEFEGHSDKRMARFYVDRQKADWSRMDAAIDKLDEIYKLRP